MKSTMLTRFALLIGLLAGLGAACDAAAQSEAELRRENERLTARVTELERELAAALDRIKVLEAQNAALKTSGGSSRLPSEQPEEEKVSIDETQADASPRALLAALKASYEATLENNEIGQSAEDRERLLYLKAVERWQVRAAREHRLGAEWHVTIESIESRGERGITLRVQAVDPLHGTRLGDTFLAMVPHNRTKAIDEGGLDRTYIFRGTLEPQIAVNPDREVVGPVDNPRLVGPFAEYELQMDVNTVIRADAPATPPRGNTGNG